MLEIKSSEVFQTIHVERQGTTCLYSVLRAEYFFKRHSGYFDFAVVWHDVQTPPIMTLMKKLYLQGEFGKYIVVGMSDSTLIAVLDPALESTASDERYIRLEDTDEEVIIKELHLH